MFATYIYDGESIGSINDNVLILAVKSGWMLDNMKALIVPGTEGLNRN